MYYEMIFIIYLNEIHMKIRRGSRIKLILTDFLNERQRHKLLAGSGRRLPHEKNWIFTP